MKLKYLIVLVGLISAAVVGCKKDDDLLERDALLLWEGEVAVDGCGFFVVVDGTKFKPTNEEIIPSSFKANDTTEVVVEYYDQNTQQAFACGLMQQSYSVIELVSIEE